ncbi:MAG: 23S rRNA (guanosine(2251)-2'-O)-methyltransferase RlmB [Thermoleophilaceae bacterium]
MIVYGRNPVREALRGRRRVTRVWVTGDGREVDRLVREAERAEGAVEVERVGSAEAVERLCGSPDHQGVCADAGDYPYASEDALLVPEDALVVCLDEVQDPHNLGAVCRAAECAGATGVVVPERRSAAVTPAVCSASAGAVEHLPVARVRNLADFVERAKRRGAWSYGAVATAQVPYDRPDYRGRVVLVLGSEGRGIRPRVAAACDELVALPVRGRVGSLNVSAAAAALLYGILQRRAGVDSVR